MLCKSIEKNVKSFFLSQLSTKKFFLAHYFQQLSSTQSHTPRSSYDDFLPLFYHINIVEGFFFLSYLLHTFLCFEFNFVFIFFLLFFFFFILPHHFKRWFLFLRCCFSLLVVVDDERNLKNWNYFVDSARHTLINFTFTITHIWFNFILKIIIIFIN